MAAIIPPLPLLSFFSLLSSLLTSLKVIGFRLACTSLFTWDFNSLGKLASSNFPVVLFLYLTIILLVVESISTLSIPAFFIAAKRSVMLKLLHFPFFLFGVG